MGNTGISFQLDENLKRKFDLWCINNNTDKTKEIVRHITEITEENKE